MAVVTAPAYPEATALQLVAEQENREDDTDMDESQKKIAELETRLKLAEQKSENDEEMRKKDEELEQAQADKTKAEAELSAAQNTIAERDAAIVVKDARIAELEAQVAELEPFKARVEALEAEKAAAELIAKQTELTHFAEAQGLDPKAEAVANAIQNVDYAALIAEVTKNGKPGAKPQVASYAMGGISTRSEYDDLLEKA